MRSINDEYETKRVIYQRQKEYRKTEEGKEALYKANKKYKIKQKIIQLYDISKTKTPICHVCGETFLGHLTIDDYNIICYNCKFRIDEKEIEEICQLIET